MNAISDISILNLAEAEKIVGFSLISYESVAKAAKQILSSHAKAVVLLLFPSKSDTFSQTYYTDGSISFWLSSSNYLATPQDAIKSIFSSAMIACLKLDYDIKDSVIVAQMFVNHIIRLSKIDHADSVVLTQENWPEVQADLPFLSDLPMNALPKSFSSLNIEKIGLYPIVDSVAWLEKLLPLEINVFQLRVKDKKGTALEDEICQGIEVAKKNGKKLFINDYWQLAIRHGAYGVHLGQEDLNTANITDIYQAGLRLGISTYGYYEVARAHAFNPSYVACGPVFPTTSKIISLAPQGTTQLASWRRSLNYPLVAIGGIDLEKLPTVLSTNVDGIALISAITQALDPLSAAQALLTTINSYVTYAE